MKNKKLIIFGAGVLGHLAYEWFTKDSDYDVVAFTTEKEYLTGDKFCGLDVVDFADIEKKYPPTEYEMYVALGWYHLNRNRKKFYDLAKAKGYKLATYISSTVFVGPGFSVGDNCFIMENCVLQLDVTIGNNVTLWSACCVEHYSKIEDNCTMAARAVVAGNSVVGAYSFVGVNASVADNVVIAPDNFIGMATAIRKSTVENSVYEGNPAQRNRFVTAKQFLEVKE